MCAQCDAVRDALETLIKVDEDGKAWISQAGLEAVASMLAEKAVVAYLSTFDKKAMEAQSLQVKSIKMLARDLPDLAADLTNL